MIIIIYKRMQAIIRFQAFLSDITNFKAIIQQQVFLYNTTNLQVIVQF